MAIIKLGRKYGEDHHRARYTDHTIELAFYLRAAGLSQQAIAKKLDAPRRTVRDWLSGNTRSVSALENELNNR